MKKQPLRHFHAGLAYYPACDEMKVQPTFDELQKAEEMFLNHAIDVTENIL